MNKVFFNSILSLFKRKLSKKIVLERLVLLKLDNRHATATLASKITFIGVVEEKLGFPRRTNLTLNWTALPSGESISQKEIFHSLYARKHRKR